MHRLALYVSSNERAGELDQKVDQAAEIKIPPTAEAP